MHDTCPPLKHLMIAVPAYTPPVQAHQHGILEAVMTLLHQGIDVDVRDGIGCCYIDLVRNDLTRQFLESSADRLLFIDADVGFTGADVVRVATTPRPVVGGLYRKKSSDPAQMDWPVAFDAPNIHYDAETTLITAAQSRGTYVPTGFLCIHRSVFEAMQPHVPEFTDNRGISMHAYFQTMIHDGLFWGEDFNFCRTWYALGGTIWIQPNLTLDHIGMQSWQGNYHEWFQDRPTWEKIEGFNHCPNLYMRAVEKVERTENVDRDAWFVEVGAFKGKSTAFMAELIRDSGKRIAFDVVDHWEGSPDCIASDPDVLNGTLQQAFARNVAYIREYIDEVYTGKSVEAAARYDDTSLDFVFLDANHETASVHADCAAWWPKIKPGGVLAGDDWSWESVHAGVHAFFTEIPGEFTLEMIDEGWWITKPEEA